MKGVVVDYQGKYAAVLCENGSVEKVLNENYEIGQEIQMPSGSASTGNLVSIETGRKKKTGLPKLVKRASALAAALILVVGLGGGIAYAMPYGTVSLDSEAEIEYTINCFDYVIDVSATNEEGDALLEQIDNAKLKNKKVDSAVAVTLEQSEVEGNFQEPAISVKVKSEQHSEQLSERLYSMMGITPAGEPQEDTALTQEMENNVEPMNPAPAGQQEETKESEPDAPEMPEENQEPMNPAGEVLPNDVKPYGEGDAPTNPENGMNFENQMPQPAPATDKML